MGIRISKDHLHPSVIESITSLIGDLNQLETTAKGNAVEAINELLANGGNKEELEALIAEIAEGKELIANAVGEPLTAEESFDEMSNDINGLLSQFKTNMMNNGVTVESGDRFKSLIDKIATMVEEGSGKGIQYAEGIIDNNSILLCPSKSTETIDVDMNLNFIPSYVFVEAPGGIIRSDMEVEGNSSVISNLGMTYLSLNTSTIHTGIKNVSAKSFSMYTKAYKNDTLYYNVYMKAYDGKPIKWYAIGVGEEDTTLRDSLASILQEEGVSVTEEDDMASLITKVDEEFNDKNNEINDSIARFPIPSWTGITLNGQLLTSDFATRLGEFTHNIQIGNSIHFIKFQGSSSNWKVLNIDTGVIEDWSAYINTSITTIQINEDNGYIYAMLEKKAFKFDISSKSWSQITINKTITSSSDVNSWLGSICVNNIIYTMYLTKRYEHVAFNKYDLTNGTEEFVTTGSNIYGGKIMKYGNKILWQAKTNGAVKSNNTLIFNPSDNTTTVAGALRLDGSGDYIYGLYDNCYFIEGDLLYYTGNYNGVKCMCIKNLTTDYDDYDVKMENTEKIGNASFICKLNNHVILSDLGFFII